MLVAAVSAIALGLLGAAGIAKTVDPGPTGGALRASHLPSNPSVVRSLGTVELAASVMGLLLGGPWVIAATVLYIGFLVFSWLALRNIVPVQSCGCFGRDDTPPSWFHVVFNVTALIALVVVGVTDGSPIPWDAPTVETSVYLGYAALGTFLAYLLLTRLPQTLIASTSQ
ncbi:MAG: MauE/DoxX family redox-associated membrane protein [Acidimicrobiia bacterium]